MILFVCLLLSLTIVNKWLVTILEIQSMGYFCSRSALIMTMSVSWTVAFVANFARHYWLIFISRIVPSISKHILKMFELVRLHSSPSMWVFLILLSQLEFNGTVAW